MIDQQKIKALADLIAKQFKPQQIILFGSYAAGTPTPDSDVDLLVVMPHKDPPAIQAAKIRQKVHAGFPIDIIVRSAEEIRKRIKMDDMFIKNILEQGLPIYES